MSRFDDDFGVNFSIILLALIIGIMGGFGAYYFTHFRTITKIEVLEKTCKAYGEI